MAAIIRCFSCKEYFRDQKSILDGGIRYKILLLNPNSHTLPPEIKHKRGPINNHINNPKHAKSDQESIGCDPVIDAPGPDPCYRRLETGYCHHEFGG